MDIVSAEANCHQSILPLFLLIDGDLPHRGIAHERHEEKKKNPSGYEDLALRPFQDVCACVIRKESVPFFSPNLLTCRVLLVGVCRARVIPYHHGPCALHIHNNLAARPNIKSISAPRAAAASKSAILSDRKVLRAEQDRLAGAAVSIVIPPHSTCTPHTSTTGQPNTSVALLRCDRDTVLPILG